MTWKTQHLMIKCINFINNLSLILVTTHQYIHLCTARTFGVHIYYVTMQELIIRNARIVNRGKIEEGDIWIRQGRIYRKGSFSGFAATEIDAQGKVLLPGIIDDQVHFREPGLTHKASIATESRAAVAGGVTSFMEMPNTKPPATTPDRLEEKYAIAARSSLANYSFYMGATNDNLEAVLRTDSRRVCGIKVFMGSSTGNMLVDDTNTLERLFATCPMLIATHCEDETTIRRNLEQAIARYGEAVPVQLHPQIRSTEACYLSSSMAVDLARRYGTRLHVLHLSTRDELALFENDKPLTDKRITAELCVHHLYFDARDYTQLGNRIKCNPAIKGPEHREALLAALLDDRLDLIATDHAPHTAREKAQPYLKAPAGLPLVQHALQIMLACYHQGLISLERIVEKMCHAPAICFRLKERGFIDEGYWADLVLVDLDKEVTVRPDNIYYKCGWSPFEGHAFRGSVEMTFVNGHMVWHNGQFDESRKGMRLEFEGWT